MRTLLCSCQQGLIFRGHESGVDNNNVQLHTQELQSLLQDPKATEGLCTICSGYGLGILHLLECPASFEDPKKNPWLQPFDSRSQFQDDCPICKLLVSLLPEGSEAPWRICWAGYSQFKKPGYDGIWKVPVYVPPEEQREKKGDEMVEWKTQRTPVIVVAPEQEPEKWWEKRRNLYGMLLPTRKLGEDVLLPRARLLKTQSADLTLAKSWIGSCEQAHGDRCSGIQPAETGLWARFSSISFAARPSDTLRVIDCRTKTRVAAPAQCQYAALSYVFGTDRASIPNDIAKWDEVPVLFQDAVAATTQLGYHYLWIDFYCISDDDDDLKARQLRTMDKVYFEAQVCSDVVKAVIYTDAVYNIQVVIVSACSEDVHIGLSGISGNHRQQSIAATIGDYTLVAVQPEEVQSTKKSKWATRGWTFQEALLSRRRLYFTEHGMYFQCEGGYADDPYATETLDGPLLNRDLEVFTRNQALLFDATHMGTYPETFWDNLKGYTAGSLTNESDALNAFAGVLNRYSAILEGFDHIWGVPVYQKSLTMSHGDGIITRLPKKVPQTYAEQLVSSLFWDEDTSQRREGFSTWSWAGAKGVIEFDNFEIRNLDLDIAIELEAGGQVPVDDYFSKPLEQRPKIGMGLYIDAPTTFIQLDTPLLKGGWYLTVNEFERNYPCTLHHGLRVSKSWNEDIKAGRYLTIILGASQATRSSRLTYHLLVLQDQGDHYERAFVMSIKDADLDNRVPEEIWAAWKAESIDALGVVQIPWIYEELPGDFGFEKEAHGDWEKVFLIAKHLRVERKVVLVR
jgi:hypothetical protein